MIHAVLLSLFIFSFFRIKFLFLFFQQKEYRNKWFLLYVIKEKKLLDTKLSLCLLVTTFYPYISIPLFFIFGFYEQKFLNKAKKKLVITSRVKRIFVVAIALVGLFVWLTYMQGVAVFTLILTIQFLPFSMILANLLLSPYEKKVQDDFLKQAIEKLNKINPIVIGITGSMGKTSTKHILSHILSGNLPVTFTPGSVNTKMGIAAFINNKLPEDCKYFVVEMGAYFKGSIKTLCDFVHPKHGIITAIGDSHYEYFKSKEVVASAKFELGEEVAKNKGFLLVNQNEIEENLLPKNIPFTKIKKIENILQTEDGLSFKYDGNDVFATIYGTHQVTNIAIAIELVKNLGMPTNSILATLRTLPQVKHRLEVIDRSGGIKIIDDAYNSNFIGFKSGLKLLQTLGGRRILITPGMVELGTLHDEQHYEIGKFAGDKVDIVILVNDERIPTFVKGFDKTKQNAILIKVQNFAMAQKWMDENLISGDVVLLENDLPDVYESRVRL
ncbi:MAG: UDP-N-acetylmuramoyl-tripeptide--D-alanyl-D-alanine ligase [Rickettsiales bacterium]|jgi:UDP-N-acetylmuramoyl-tripeptide--D-alanyl-D-alanine ligase|nr:UDP-N-acetylmuramoyl-tripeptide--D-alanyl-D-alanine ligase [Rickettsiales bacterium]